MRLYQIAQTPNIKRLIQPILAREDLTQREFGASVLPALCSFARVAARSGQGANDCGSVEAVRRDQQRVCSSCAVGRFLRFQRLRVISTVDACVP